MHKLPELVHIEEKNAYSKMVSLKEEHKWVLMIYSKIESLEGI